MGSLGTSQLIDQGDFCRAATLNTWRALRVLSIIFLHPGAVWSDKSSFWRCHRKDGHFKCRFANLQICSNHDMLLTQLVLGHALADRRNCMHWVRVTILLGGTSRGICKRQPGNKANTFFNTAAVIQAQPAQACSKGEK